MLIQEAQRNLMDVVGGCVAARWTLWFLYLVCGVLRCLRPPR